MERSITLNILAEDILNNSYYDYKECPITRALHRAGHTKAHDTGGIQGTIGGEEVNIYCSANKDYDNMLMKLLSMYRTKGGHEVDGDNAITIEDFTHIINY